MFHPEARSGTAAIGIPQDPFDGTSLAYAFGDAKAPGVSARNISRSWGSRAIYHDGWMWMASAFGPRTPWLPGPPPGIHEWTPDTRPSMLIGRPDVS